MHIKRSDPTCIQTICVCVCTRACTCMHSAILESMAPNWRIKQAKGTEALISRLTCGFLASQQETVFSLQGGNVICRAEVKKQVFPFFHTADSRRPGTPPMGTKAEGDKAEPGRDLKTSHKPVTPVSWAKGSIPDPSASVSPRRHKKVHSRWLHCSSWRNLTNRMDLDKLRTKKAMQTVKKTPEGRSQWRWS